MRSKNLQTYHNIDRKAEIYLTLNCFVLSLHPMLSSLPPHPDPFCFLQEGLHKGEKYAIYHLDLIPAN